MMVEYYKINKTELEMYYSEFKKTKQVQKKIK